jgi:uncharacterized protein YndB with AHSA1/START domain
MSSRAITYVIHIATTHEELWQTLTNAEALKTNWGKINSVWTVGSEVTEVDDAGKVLWKGKILRSEAPHVLSYTMGVVGIAEPPTQVTFELGSPETEVQPKAPVVRLTLTQSGFTVDSKLYADCARAWPEIISSIKTYVETGKPLRFHWKH